MILLAALTYILTVIGWDNTVVTKTFEGPSARTECETAKAYHSGKQRTCAPVVEHGKRQP